MDKRLYMKTFGGSLAVDISTTEPYYEWARFTPDEDIEIVGVEVYSLVNIISQNDHVQEGWVALSQDWGSGARKIAECPFKAEWNTSPAAVYASCHTVSHMFPAGSFISVREGEVLYLQGSVHYVPVGVDQIVGGCLLFYHRKGQKAGW